RISLPSQFRRVIAGPIILSYGLDQCLFGFDQSGWEKFSSQLSSAPLGMQESRAFTRFILGGAVLVEPDKSGRILIPEHLAIHAKLSEKVMITGVGDRIEFWDETTWKNYTDSTKDDLSVLADTLTKAGLL
ncbi:MAG: division/cell wall cluster transcriptional repressor MraZ, partial [Bacteroidota bacterium]